jgi:hypothetical protein
MADTRTNEQEPSIEEILDSIRQIISDDEEPASQREAAVALDSTPKPKSSDMDDVLTLTEHVEARRDSDLDLSPKPSEKPVEVELRDFEPEPVIPPYVPDAVPAAPAMPVSSAPAASSSAAPDIETLLTRKAQDAALAGFTEIAHRAAIDRSGQVSIEDVVRDELRPMLRDWLDKHLPAIIDRLVQKELERISQRVMGD